MAPWAWTIRVPTAVPAGPGIELMIRHQLGRTHNGELRLCDSSPRTGSALVDLLLAGITSQ